MALRDARDAGDDLTGSAIAALEGIALDEGRLQGMEPLALRQSLDGADLTPFGQGSEPQARLHALAVH